MPASLYTISYDLSADRERDRVAHVLEGFGARAQFWLGQVKDESSPVCGSVFECRLTRGMKERLLSALEALQVESGTIHLYPAAPDSQTFPALCAAFRTLIAQHFADLPGIIETLGDPAMVRQPVHYPQAAGPQPGDATFETDRYEWFVANDHKDNRQALTPIRPGQPIPAMERLPRVQRRHR